MRKRTSWNLGIPTPEAVKLRISKALKGRNTWSKGVRRTEAEKRHLSKVFKGRPSPNKGRVWSEEYKKKMSLALKGVNTWSKGRKLTLEHRKRISISGRGKVRSEESKARYSAARALRRFPFNGTIPEKVLGKELRSLGFKVKKQFRPDWCKWHAFDFALPEIKTVVEADGCYWHNCPSCVLRLCHSTDEKKRVKRVRNNDLKVKNIVAKNGWEIVRLWEHEILAGDFRKLHLLFQEIAA